MATEKTTKKNLYQKLLEIQKTINGLGKDKSGGQFRYVTGDKVLEHLKPLMNDLGILLKQEVLSIENTRQDYKTRNGEASEINSKVMMKFTWVDAETGDKDENLFGANGQNAWDKGVGSALTYGERYFLLKYFHIATDEDDIDNPERKPAEVAPQVQPPAQMQVAPELADKAIRDGLLLALEGFKGLYTAEELPKLKKTAETLTAEAAEDFKKNLQNGILNRIKKARPKWNHAASEAQLDLIDKMLLSHLFTAEEKATFNSASYEYDNIDGSNRVDWLTTQMKERKTKTAA